MDVVWALAFAIVVSWVAFGVATVFTAYCTPSVRQAVLEHSKQALRRAQEQQRHRAWERGGGYISPRAMARMRRERSDFYHLVAAALALSSRGFYALPLLLRIIGRIRSKQG